MDAHRMELRKVERYWETRVELVSALTEDTSSGLMAILEVKSKAPEGLYVVDVEGDSLGESLPNDHAPAAASTSNPVFPLSHYA